jgi:D-arabinose 1-dehydrogenase-like Zn-dependent alcohol dehydrogenase
VRLYFHYFLRDMGTIDDPSALYPRIQGHEAAGTMVEVGADCPPHLTAGPRVALWPVSGKGLLESAR